MQPRDLLEKLGALGFSGAGIFLIVQNQKIIMIMIKEYKSLDCTEDKDNKLECIQ